MPTQLPSISVVMATYNGERFLEEQLRSLEQQSLRPSELIICDDGSTDATCQILEAFRLNSSFPVKVYVNANRLGYRKNFLRGTTLTSGAVIAFCDQDDIWHPDKLATLSKFFFEREKLLLIHDISVFESDSKKVLMESYFEELRASRVPYSVNLKGCSIAMSRNLIELIGYPPDNGVWAHDTWFALLAISLDLHSFMDKALISYRIHNSNVSGWLFTRNAFWKRLITRIGLSRSTSDRFIGFCVDNYSLADLEREMHRLRYLAPHRVGQILAALAKRKKVFLFQSDSRYSQAFWRVTSAFRLLLSGNYSASGDITGFLVDLRGR